VARFYAQVCTALFLVAVAGGLVLGDAAHLTNGAAGGNLGGVTLHMTWTRDALDAVILVLFVLVGFVLARTPGRYVVIAVGAALLLLGVAGVVVGDNAAASKGLLDMHFPLAVNLFDLIIGAFGILAGLGTLPDHEV
jgi:hypothetical protein